MPEKIIRMDPVVESNTKFSSKLYQELLKEYPDKNIFFSPLSISIVMSMLMAGAKKNTLSQMKEAMGLDHIDEEVIHSSYQNILSDLAETTNIANRIFMRQNYRALPSFLNLLEQKYKAGCTPLNFGDDESVNVINEWVRKETRNKIETIVQSPLNPETALLIMNAIYFKSTWSNQFDPDFTNIDQFYINDHETVPVKMMAQEGTFGLAYDQATKTKVLELPHSNKKTSMLFFLPDEINGLTHLENNFDDQFLKKVLKNMKRKRETMVKLPSFQLEEKYPLKNILQNLGMVQMFIPNIANFLGITDSRDLFVNDVVQKSFIEVKEDGVEAVAVTSCWVSDGLGSGPHNLFNANHPFLFCILDKPSQNILFLGKLIKPKAVTV